MRVRDIIRRAAKNLRQAKLRTILTSLAIGVGAFTIALALAAGNGGRNYLSDVVSGAGDMRTIQVSAKQDAMSEEHDDKPKKVGEKSQPSQYVWKDLKDTDRSAIEAVEGVEKASPIFSVSALSVASNGSDKYQGSVSVQYDGTAIDLTAGKLAENNEILPGQIVLPHIYIDSFGFTSAEEAIGKKVIVEFDKADGKSFDRSFTIVAVDAEPTSPLAFYNDEFRISNHDGEEISKAQQPAGSSESYYALMVTVDKGADVEQVKQSIVGDGKYEAMTFAEMRTSVMQMVNIV